MILHHHERYDGKGYPEGLKAEAIPLGSRIIGVAEAFAGDGETLDKYQREYFSIFLMRALLLIPRNLAA